MSNTSAHSPNPPIRLCLLSGAPDCDGQPQAALEVPPEPSAINRRPTLMLFSSIAAAIAAKRAMEKGAAARQPNGSAAA